MFHLGESQELYVVKEVGFGIYLGEEENATEKVLLPKKEVPEGIKAGDILEVFLYKDSQDRLIATTRTPKVRLGETAVLRVADTGKIGAFLDWGLEKDLSMVMMMTELMISLYGFLSHSLTRLRRDILTEILSQQHLSLQLHLM